MRTFFDELAKGSHLDHTGTILISSQLSHHQSIYIYIQVVQPMIGDVKKAQLLFIGISYNSSSLDGRSAISKAVSSYGLLVLRIIPQGRHATCNHFGAYV